jgi:hypothetical protein
MKNRRINPPAVAYRHSRAYHQAFKRLDALLENGIESSNSEKIEILGRHLFGDLWHARNNQPTGLAEMKTP